MSRSTRGAAQVSLMWVIALAVISLVSILFAFMSQQKLVDVQTHNNSLQAKAQEEMNRYQGEVEKNTAISTAVGFTGTEGSETSIETVKAATAELKATFGIDGDLRNLASAVPGVVSKYQALTSERDSLQGEVSRLRGDLEARQASFRTSMSEKDQQLRDARRSAEDDSASLNNQILDLERQRDGLREQYQDLDRQAGQAKSRAAEDLRQKDAAYAILKQRNDILSSRLNDVARRQSTTDGSILSASPEIDRAWIDIGRLARVRPGMQFEVRNPVSGAVKGQVKILSVEERRSEVAILSMVDKYDPIRSNDEIFNGLLDTNRNPVAVLLGNGFGRYSAADLTAMLAEVGIEVRTNVTIEADYLLLGTPFFDEDTGDMISWPSHDAYKASTALSVKILPIRDWMVWLGE